MHILRVCSHVYLSKLDGFVEIHNRLCYTGINTVMRINNSTLEFRRPSPKCLSEGMFLEYHSTNEEQHFLKLWLIIFVKIVLRKEWAMNYNHMTSNTNFF